MNLEQKGKCITFRIISENVIFCVSRAGTQDLGPDGPEHYHWPGLPLNLWKLMSHWLILIN